MLQTHVTTKQFSKMLGVNPDTVRRGLCVNGHYLGLKPIKMPNRMLMWPVANIDKLFSEDQKKAIEA